MLELLNSGDLIIIVLSLRASQKRLMSVFSVEQQRTSSFVRFELDSISRIIEYLEFMLYPSKDSEDGKKL